MSPSLRLLFFPAMLAACLFLLPACDEEANSARQPVYSDEPNSDVQILTFGVHPLHNPARLHEVFSPLMRYLEEHIPGTKFRVEASRNYAAYDKKLYAAKFHFSLPNPYQTINALEHGYRVFGKMADDFNFKGIILVRKDSGIETLSDLEGQAVSFPAPSELAATMMPQYFLQSNGLNVIADIDIRYVGSQESSIMNVFLGDTAAGATWPPPWRLLSAERPELAEQLEIKWQTSPLPNNSLVVRKDVSPDLVDKVATLLFDLHKNDHGKALLDRMELSMFEPAEDRTYQPVVEFIDTFAKTVRPLH